MAGNFTDEQVEKRVVDQKGVEVGAVAYVRDGDLYVEVGPKADNETLEELRWDGMVHQDAQKLHHEHIGDVGESVIRLNVG